MNFRSTIEAARRWADTHRELVIIGVALPLSTLATAIARAQLRSTPALPTSRAPKRFV
jgi:hypothetical protein